ncbi:MAG: signal recognition particle-docking protein FtsY [Gemmatimonadetes bacterium RIFCSPLOWO2_12_FULL_68_9]|nr:MAG: signal recognition particle-docking protein FtsY [Gemmatimonadetes bacterium RIFCSPLOWO2_12_FULL_68_9]
MDLAPSNGPAVIGGLWRRIRTLALTDVSALWSGPATGTLEQLERVLVEADFGAAAYELLGALETDLPRGELTSEEAVRGWLVRRIADLLRNGADPGRLNLGDGSGPAVLLMLGVNGVGKTTQLAKLAHRLMAQGHSVLVAAADTYRAGAAEQLRVWAERLGVPCVAGAQRADPAAVVFDAIEAAQARGANVVLVDTAGRLHTQADLMEELKKIRRVIARKREGAPHESLLVLDATIGQNAVPQGKAFAAALPLTGLVVTKLDGTARGGSVVALRRELKVPLRFLGTGEALDDLEVFDPVGFAERLLAD